MKDWIIIGEAEGAVQKGSDVTWTQGSTYRTAKNGEYVSGTAVHDAAPGEALYVDASRAHKWRFLIRRASLGFWKENGPDRNAYRGDYLGEWFIDLEDLGDVMCLCAAGKWGVVMALPEITVTSKPVRGIVTIYDDYIE